MRSPRKEDALLFEGRIDYLGYTIEPLVMFST